MEEVAVPLEAIMMLIIPNLDVISDWLIVVRSIINGQLFSQGILYLVGLGFFSTSQMIRILMLECSPSRGGVLGFMMDFMEWFPPLVCLENHCNPENECRFHHIIPFLFMVAIFLITGLIGAMLGLLVGVCVVAERAVRLTLCPLDLFLACGYYGANKEFVMLVRDELFLLTKSEKQFFASQPWFMWYYHMWCSLVVGGRWQATVFREWDVQHGTNDVQLARTLCMYALAEEVLENIGGVLMAVASLLYNSDQTPSVDRGIAIASLTISGISMLTETGYFIGMLNKFQRPT